MNQTPSVRVDIISDVVCPWCAIGYYQLTQAAQNTGIDIDIHWHPFELNPNMEEGGENLRAHLAAKYGTTLEDSIKARARLTKLGASFGFEFNYTDDMRMVNTFRAHQLIDIAETLGKGHETVLALFNAFFTRRKNLNDIDTLIRISGEIGLDQDFAREALESGARKKSVREKQAYWGSQGISGVPAMVFENKHLLTGAQGKENYARILNYLMPKSK